MECPAGCGSQAACEESCPDCGYEQDYEDASNPGYCEDFPCCGHEAGDCFGRKYGSDESIKQAVYDRMNDDYDAVDEGW